MATIALLKKKETDMTSGSIFNHIVAFAIPLLLGNLFQQLYNTVDTWVVGNYVGKVAFSAVGQLSPVTNTVIGFFSGFSSGASVVISRYFGAHDTENVSRAVHTYVKATLILCVFFTVLGTLIVPLMINVLNSSAEIAAEQKIYLRIYFAGVSSLMLYNMGSAILRAIGNSTFPFIFLVVSTVVNIILDLVFVLGFGMGTQGVAIATVMAQTISAILVVSVLLRTDTVVKVHIDKLNINTKILLEEVRIGFPSAIQMSITAFSNVFVYSYINFFNTDVTSGWTAYNKIDQLFFLPMQSISLATTTFVGQNLGANDIGRAIRGVKTALFMAWGATLCLITPVMIFAPHIVSLFIDNSESGVIYYGTMFLRMNGPFFLAACVNQVMGAALRGCGKSEVPMATMLFSFVLFRQVYLFVVTRYISNTPQTVGISFPVGWTVCSLIIGIFYLVVFPKEKREKDK
ncbi:MAG: MATE family efflux transporter [Sphaerochaetaceae bacterium]|nr:MATE family efflux transporter [Sphaerochaetaceae bacterium]